ncbi:Glucosidase 2 subunit beta [Eumeta japonica]|uniref:Glucosidase 2 subunit beta n=1 Tax=Eumeta variegata TaxID=151549 RepID=A0A4C2A548_EUMVA|nr:Glucosidase 2 subunit beta [Eumeta japonica]
MVNICVSDYFYSFSFIICYFSTSVYTDVPRPRGVSLAKASLYSPTKDFTCFDGTGTIPFNYINDDYCDCFDGSDEPGTSACLNGVFYCTNAGHRAQNIPSSRVNDGLCDCCDGTDEYASGASCPNICDELGQEARAEAQRKAELYKAGSQLRQELIEKGNKKRNEMAEQLSQLEKDKAEAEKIRSEKESLKDELEKKENEALQVYRDAEERERLKKAEEENEANKKEAEETFAKFDSNNNGQLSINEIVTRVVFDKDRNGEVSEEEAKEFIGERESIDLENFVSETWPLLKPLLMMEQGLFQTSSQTSDTEQTDTEAEEDDKEAIGENEDVDQEEEHLEEELPHDDVESIDTEPKQQYDDETQKLVDEATEARRQHTNAERTVREIESNIRNIKENLEKDYGPQQEFATLDGQCFEYEDKEYVYKHCLFQKVTQKSKNGGSEIGLGTWGEWAGGENPYEIMKYTNGVTCWNGPSRSTSVYVQCGLENKILSVTEPFRCEYKIEFITPAACDDSQPSNDSFHDEL